MSRLYRRSDVVAENKVAPMYQKKQATARQAKAVVDARPPISCELVAKAASRRSYVGASSMRDTGPHTAAWQKERP
jgi:hypothetical protein